MIYDIDGTPLAGEVSQEAVTEAFIGAVASGEINLGSQVGATLAFSNSLTQAWQDNAAAAYALMKAAYKAGANKGIPFFISTDQHGTGVEQHRWANNIDADGVNFVNINLGDTVTDHFNASQLTSARSRTVQVKNFISITGNHDALWGPSSEEQPSIFDLTHYFHSTFDRAVIDKVNSSYTVFDAEHLVKYLVVDNYFNVGTTQGGLGNDQLPGNVAAWLIKEMSKDDYDLVYLQHWMLYAPANTYTYRDGTPDTNGIGGPQALRTLVTARRNKLSGSVTDMDGVVHSYDFTGCTHDLLCALHGHEHDEVYATLDNLLCYVSDWFGNNKTCVFGLIDRGARTLTVWKFDATTVFDPFTMNL